jgi:hypothetical protein
MFSWWTCCLFLRNCNIHRCADKSPILGPVLYQFISDYVIIFCFSKMCLVLSWYLCLCIPTVYKFRSENFKAINSSHFTSALYISHSVHEVVYKCPKGKSTNYETSGAIYWSSVTSSFPLENPTLGVFVEERCNVLRQQTALVHRSQVVRCGAEGCVALRRW